MKKLIETRILVCALAFAAAGLLAAPVVAQQTAAAAPTASPGQTSGPQAALVNDVGNLSDKFVGLARVMAGKYDWRPGQGVRSVGDVFNLIVMENKMLAGLLSGSGGGMPGGRGAPPAPITDPAEMQEALRTSYAALRQTISGLSESDLNASVKLFGRDMTKQGAAFMLIMDQHEHLGQSIAYARTNSVVPPWSK
jgi:DinB superfamily